MLNHAFVGICRDRYEHITEIVVLNDQKELLSFWLLEQHIAIGNYFQDLYKVLKNKEVITFDHKLTTIYSQLNANRTWIERLLNDLVINDFCQYDFLCNENKIVLPQYTKSIRAVLDVYSRMPMFEAEFKAIVYQETDLFAKGLSREFSEKQAYFEAFYLSELYTYLHTR